MTSRTEICTHHKNLLLDLQICHIFELTDDTVLIERLRTSRVLLTLIAWQRTVTLVTPRAAVFCYLSKTPEGSFESFLLKLKSK